MQTISVRLTSDLKIWLEQKASEDGRSLNRQIVQLIKSAKASDDSKPGDRNR